MAGEDIAISGLQAQAAGAGQFIWNAGGYIILGIVIVAATGFLLYYLSFKHKVIIRVRTKKADGSSAPAYIIADKARRISENGVPRWHLWAMKKKITPPPPEAINLSAKGKMYAECYWSEDNPEPIWLKDNGKSDGAIQPFTTQERALHVEGITKALMRKKKGILETIVQLVFPIAMVIILVCVFAFWGELTKPLITMMQMNNEVAAQNAKISEQNVRLYNLMQADCKEKLALEQIITSNPFSGNVTKVS